MALAGAVTLGQRILIRSTAKPQPRGVSAGRVHMYPEISADMAKQQQFAGIQAGRANGDASLGQNLSQLLSHADSIAGQIESVRGRLFGYGPPSATVGSNNIKEVSPDTIEDTINRLSRMIGNIGSTVSYLDSRL